MKILAAVYDQKSESYGRPIMELTIGSAIRAFEAEMKQEESALKKFPQDFSLWQIGVYDETKGEIKGLAQKINLANAWELNQNKNEPAPRV